MTAPIHRGDEKHLVNVLETGRTLRVSGCAGGIGNVTLPLVIMNAISAPRYRGGPIDPSTTRDAVLWLAIELVIGVWLWRGAREPVARVAPAAAAAGAG